MNKYDYIIVGSGAGGSAAAYKLAIAGKQVLLLEKGGQLPRDESTLSVGKVARDGLFLDHEPWLDGDGKTIVPQEWYNLGGKTKWYGAALLRFSPEEFETDNERKYLPWPIGYDELEPYYAEAERLLGVRFFEMEPELRAIVEKLQKSGAGWRAEALPLGLKAEILEHPQEAKHFDGFASPGDLKSDGETSLLAHVRNAPNLTIATGKDVAELVPATDDPPRITGVLCADGNRYEADRVLLAAGALHSPRLLQRYLERTGLNASLPCYSMVGRNYKCHIKTFLLAVSPSRKTDLLRKTILLLNDRFPHSSVQTLGWMDGEIVGAQLSARTPRWLADYIGSRAYGFFLQTEEGSHPDNRVVDGVNGSRPILDFKPARLPAAVAEHRGLVRAFRWSLQKAGFLSGVRAVPPAGTAHACGTLAAGSHPDHSVVDACGRVHGMENLYVVDGSVLPRASRVNPSLTIYAWALRVASLVQSEGYQHEQQ